MTKKISQIEIACDLGFDAGIDGKSRDSNPYDSQAQKELYDWWEIGWLEAQPDDSEYASWDDDPGLFQMKK